MDNLIGSKNLKETLEKLSLKYSSDETFNNIVNELTFHSTKDRTAFILVKNAFFKQLIEDNFLNEIQSEFSKNIGEKWNVKIITSPSEINKPNQHIKEGIFEDIDASFTFDNFVVTDYNRDVYKMAESFIKSKTLYSLFIWGGVGLGKTHLLHALAHKFKTFYPEKNVKYVGSNDLIREVYLALAASDKLAIERLKENYEKIDLLLVDDVQMLAKKEKLNEIIFNIFNKNIASKKRIIWTADKDITNQSGLEKRLISRILSGFNIRIKNPTPKNLCLICSEKLKMLDVKHTEDVCTYLANRCNSDIRILEGLVHQLHFFVSTDDLKNEKGMVTLSDVKTMMPIPTNKNDFIQSINADSVIFEVCTIYGVTESQVKSTSRVAGLVTPRNVAMYILREKYNFKHKDIGAMFSNRTHSSVIDSVDKIKKQIKQNKDLANVIESVVKKI